MKVVDREYIRAEAGNRAPVKKMFEQDRGHQLCWSRRLYGTRAVEILDGGASGVLGKAW